ncbi:MAG TPA: hypothetical protein VF226_19010 [Hyphomicrobiaceae bacterium]|jgi:hypothetical protein
MRAYEKPDLIKREPLTQITAHDFFSPPVVIEKEVDGPPITATAE